MIGTVLALGLNLVFRIGVQRKSILLVQPRTLDTEAVQAFMDRCGGSWGARADVIRRASFALTELLDTLVNSLGVQEPICITARFNEFRVDVRAAYAGALVILTTQRPSVDEIADLPAGVQQLSGYLIRRSADQVRTGRRGDLSVVDLQFDH